MATNAAWYEDNSNVEADYDNTVPNISAAERAVLRAAATGNHAGFECFNCGYSCKFGELSCPKCQTMFASGGKTHKFNEQESPAQPGKKWPIGEVFVKAQQTITLHIDSLGQQFVLPTQDTLIVGRVSDMPGDLAPDVSLSPFNAQAEGVSRRHLKISRVRDTVYVTDLESCNGTYFNGRRLAPNISRLLRNGDELRLGYLKLRVTFSG